MTSLLIDAGNSRLKWAIYRESKSEDQREGQLEPGDPVVYQWSTLDKQLAHVWQSLMGEKHSPTRIILANVAGQRVLDALEQWRESYLTNQPVIQESAVKESMVKETSRLTIDNVVAQACAYGVKNAYQKPETLGVDRWVALVAAQRHIKGDACIIDCGTALTIDILTADGTHKGGVIAPGWGMMEKSLTVNTEGISYRQSDEKSEMSGLLAKNTLEAVHAGVSAACAGAVEHIVRRYQKEENTSLHCILTGGAAPLLLQKLLLTKSSITFHHEPDWVLKGLAVISENTAGGSGKVI